MKYSVSNEGVEALRSMAQQVSQASSQLQGETNRLSSITSDYDNVLGPHKQSIDSALADISSSINRSAEPANNIAGVLSTVADKYQSVIDKNAFGRGAGGSSGAPGSSSSGGSGSGGSGAGSGNTTDSLVSENEFSYEDKVSWVSDNVGCSSEEATKIVNSMEYYSGTGYSDIHWDEGNKSPHTQNIMKVFDSNNVPRYSGVVHRGLSFDSKDELLGAIRESNGNWREPGITSFSTDRNVADGFASQKKYGLVITVKNGGAGIPFSHISRLPHEREVLYPGSSRGVSWDIVKDSARFDPAKRIVYVDVIERS